jgi:membrane protein
MDLKHTMAIIKDLVRAWKSDKVPQTAAAFAYYAIFLIPPFLAIILAILGIIFGNVVSRQDILDELRFLVGRGPAMAIFELLTAFKASGFTVPTLIIASMFLIFTGSHAYLSLREAFNHIWGIASKEKSNWKKFILNRFVSFIFTAAAGLTFIWLVGASTMLLVFSRSLSVYFQISPFILGLLNILISFLITMALFMIIGGMLSPVPLWPQYYW